MMKNYVMEYKKDGIRRELYDNGQQNEIQKEWFHPNYIIYKLMIYKWLLIK